MMEKKPEYLGLHWFEEKVCFFCYGDDVIFSIADEIKEIFNNQTIHDYFAKFDVKYTDVMKGETMRKYCSLEEATFLKFGFRKFLETSYAGGVWICVPDEADLRDTINWVRKPKGTKNNEYIERVLTSAALMNCDDALRKMWFHGRSKFEQFQKDIVRFWADYDKGNGIYVPRTYSFNGLQLEYGIPLRGQEAILQTFDKRVYEYEIEDLETINFVKSLALCKKTFANQATSVPYEETETDESIYSSSDESDDVCVDRGATSSNVDVPKNTGGISPYAKRDNFVRENGYGKEAVPPYCEFETLTSLNAKADLTLLGFVDDTLLLPENNKDVEPGVDCVDFDQ
jgi:hypothetical protein